MKHMRAFRSSMASQIAFPSGSGCRGVDVRRLLGRRRGLQGLLLVGLGVPQVVEGPCLAVADRLQPRLRDREVVGVPPSRIVSMAGESPQRPPSCRPARPRARVRRALDVLLRALQGGESRGGVQLRLLLGEHGGAVPLQRLGGDGGSSGDAGLGMLGLVRLLAQLLVELVRVCLRGQLLGRRLALGVPVRPGGRGRCRVGAGAAVAPAGPGGSAEAVRPAAGVPATTRIRTATSAALNPPRSAPT